MMRAAPARGLVRTLFRLLGRILIGLLLFLILGTGGLLLWLRTPSAVERIADLTRDALAEQGLFLDLQAVAGPLPGRLELRGLQLSDANGPLFRAERVFLSLALASLLKGRLEIAEVRLETPELLRLPESSSEPAPSEPAGPLPVLPLDIVLSQLRVENGLLHTAALSPAPETAEPPAAGPDAAGPSADATGMPKPPPDAPILSFALSGEAALRGSALTANLQTSLRDGEENSLSLTLRLSSALHNPDNLNNPDTPQSQADIAAQGDVLHLSLHAAQRPGGALGLLLGRTDLPGFRLDVTGDGPVRDWNGRLLLLAAAPDASGVPGASGTLTTPGTDTTSGTAPTAYALPVPGAASTSDDASLLQARIDFALHCATGSFWRDLALQPDFTLSLDSVLLPGAVLPAPLPGLLGREVRLGAGLSGKGAAFSGQADLHASAWSLSLTSLSFAPATDPDRKTWNLPATETLHRGSVLHSVLRWEVSDLPTLLAALETTTETAAKDAPGRAFDPSPGSPVPLTAASLQTDIAGYLGPDYAALSLDGTLSAMAGTESFPLSMRLEAARDGELLRLQRLDLQGIGLDLRASAQMRGTNGPLQAKATLEAADHAAWQRLAMLLADLENHSAGTASPLGGALSLTASLSLPGAKEQTEEQANAQPPAAQEQAAHGPAAQAPTAHDSAAPSPAPASDAAAVDASAVNAAASAAPAAATPAVDAPASAAPAAAAPAVDAPASAAPAAAAPGADAPAMDAPAVDAAAAPNADAPAAAAPGARAPATGSLRLVATDMRWPTEQLAALFGPSIEAVVGLSGGDNLPYVLRLDTLKAGILEADGTASYAPLPAPENASLPEGRLSANLRAGIRDLAPLAGPDSGLSGPLQLSLQADGLVSATRVSLLAQSPGLELPTGPLRNVELRLTGKTAVSERELAAQGDLNLSVGASPGGPLSLRTDWQAALPNASAPPDSSAAPSGSAPSSSARLTDPARSGAAASAPALTAALRGLLLQGAGLRVTADLSAALPPADQPGAPPALDGALGVDIREWEKLAALSGLPLSGAPASLNLTLNSAGNRQAAQMTASLPQLRLREPGAPPSFRLRDMRAEARATDLFGAPALNVSLRTGPGKAGPLSWSDGSGSMQGGNGRGDFSLALRRKRASSASQPAVPTNKAARQNPAGTEDLLDLRGGYNLERREITVNTLALRDTQKQAGVALQRPLTVTLADGLQLAGLDLAFTPAGRLTADAAMTPDSLRLQADLRDLSFDFFRLFTAAGLPDGALTAKADIRASGGVPQGRFEVDARMSATQTASGLIRSGTAEAGRITGGKGNGTTPGAKGSTASAKAAAPAPGNAGGANGTGGTNGAGGKAIFALLLNGELVANQRAAAPGRVWLRGKGSLGSADKDASAREGALSFQLPMRAQANGIPVPDSGAPLNARLNWNGPVDPLWQTVPLPDRHLTGQVLLDAALDGSLDDPRPSLRAYMADGRFEDIVNGLLINGITLEATTQDNGDVRALLAAKDAQSGNLALEADVSGLRGQNASPAIRLRGQLDGFRPLHRDDLNVILSGLFRVQGPLSRPQVGAEINVDQGEFLLAAARFGGSVPTLDVVNRRSLTAANEAAKEAAKENAPDGKNEDSEDADVPDGPDGPTLQLHIVIPDRFFIRGMGLDSEWRGDLQISGSAAAPAINGALRPVRGYLDILSRTFAFTGGDITFAGGTTINPLINLELTYENPDITAIIRAEGTAKKPKLSLESRPPLPQDEVLARVLFGKRVSDLSRFEAIQLANSMRELTGTGGSALDVMTNLRREFGLDMLRIGSSQDESARTTSGQSGESNLVGQQTGSSDAESTPTLEAGKYITDNIFVGVEQGATGDSTAVRVEVELFPRITLEGRSSSTASEIGLGWKWDY